MIDSIYPFLYMLSMPMRYPKDVTQSCLVAATSHRSLGVTDMLADGHRSFGRKFGVTDCFRRPRISSSLGI